jgi:hypothetical protein
MLQIEMSVGNGVTAISCVRTLMAPTSAHACLGTHLWIVLGA